MTARLRLVLLGAPGVALQRRLEACARPPVDVAPAATLDEAVALATAGPVDVCVVVGERPASLASELVRELRKEQRHAPVLCVAHVVDPGDEAQALRSGAADYVVFEDASTALLERALTLALEHAGVPGAVLRSERRFHSLIEVSPEAILVHQRGIVLYVNPAVVTLLGYASKVDLVARPIHELVHADDLRTVWNEQRSLVEQGRTSPRRECRFVRCDGTVATTEVVAIPIVLGADKAVLTVATDVTERKELQARLLFTDRLASMGRLAAGVAHEINNPLAYVLTNLEFVREALDAQAPGAEVDELRKAVREALEGAGRVRHIVRDLKTLSRGDEDVRAPVDLRAIIASVAKIASSEVRARAQLSERMDVVPLVMGNEARLGQVFLNLLLNAAEAIPAGRPLENRVTIETRTAGGRAVVEVSDTGLGVSPENLARIFAPFFTTKPAGVGTGLGLAICQSIVTSMDGTITVKSTPGEGTTFTVSLPAAPTQTPSLPVKSPRLAAGPRARILVIDDEPPVGRAMARVLQREHDVETLVDPRVALERIRAGERFDVVFCDLMMPDMTGMDFHAELARSFPELAERVVFITGGAFTPEAQEFLDGVPNATIEKPASLGQLRKVLADRLR